MFLSAVSRVDPKGRLRGLGRKVGSACEEFEDSEGGIIGLMFLRVLVPADPGCPRRRAVQRFVLL